MEKFIVFIFCMTVIKAELQQERITGTTPPPVDCPNKLCHGKYDGNYEYTYPHTDKVNLHYYVQCSGGNAYCQACWPLVLEFSPKCNQCLYTKIDDCVTTKVWDPAAVTFCPDQCPERGPDFTGNINDHYNPYHYIACWKGVTAGCIACPNHLEFNEKANACLYEGKYRTEQNYDE